MPSSVFSQFYPPVEAATFTSDEPVETDRRAILRRLVAHGVRRVEIANQLGISRARVYQLIRAMGLENSGPPPASKRMGRPPKYCANCRPDPATAAATVEALRNQFSSSRLG